jgi:hypothetical protein
VSPAICRGVRTLNIHIGVFLAGFNMYERSSRLLGSFRFFFLIDFIALLFNFIIPFCFLKPLVSRLTPSRYGNRKSVAVGAQGGMTMSSFYKYNTWQFIISNIPAFNYVSCPGALA